MKKTLQMQQGQRLKLLRKQLLKLTQDQLGEEVGVDGRTILRYEKGEFAMPEIFYLTLASNHDNVNVEFIKHGTGEMYKESPEMDVYHMGTAEPPQPSYGKKTKENTVALSDCMTKLALAKAEITSLRSQLKHANLLLQMQGNQPNKS